MRNYKQKPIGKFNLSLFAGYAQQMRVGYVV